jgi:hypothetical protein
LREANPGKRVEVWAEDESRLGLKPIARRVWALRGHRPRSCGRTRYEWLYVYGFARPRTGESFGVLLPRVKAERMGEALAAFVARADPDSKKVLVVLVDNAGWPVDRSDGPSAGDPPGSAGVPGGSPRDCAASYRLPMGAAARMITIQCNSVSETLREVRWYLGILVS